MPRSKAKPQNPEPSPHPKTIMSQIGGFTPMIDALTDRYGYITAAVFGKVWRYCQMKTGLCYAGIERMAEELRMNETTFRTSLKILVADGFLEDLDPGVRNRPHRYRDTGKVLVMMNAFATIVEFNGEAGPQNRRTKNKNGPPILGTEDPKIGGPWSSKREDEDSIKDRNKEVEIQMIQYTQVKQLLKDDMGADNIQIWRAYIEPTELINVVGNEWWIAAPDGTIASWLTSRTKKVMERLLAGIANTEINLSFVEARQDAPQISEGA